MLVRGDHFVAAAFGAYTAYTSRARAETHFSCENWANSVNIAGQLRRHGHLAARRRIRALDRGRPVRRHRGARAEQVDPRDFDARPPQCYFDATVADALDSYDVLVDSKKFTSCRVSFAVAIHLAGLVTLYSASKPSSSSRRSARYLTYWLM
jgi:hypothetical protein